jgi:hypothetical protein
MVADVVTSEIVASVVMLLHDSVQMLGAAAERMNSSSQNRGGAVFLSWSQSDLSPTDTTSNALASAMAA